MRACLPAVLLATVVAGGCGGGGSEGPASSTAALAGSTGAPSAGGTPPPQSGSGSTAAEWTTPRLVGTSRNDQSGPSLARLSDGTNAVTWVSAAGGAPQVLVRRYDDNGTPVGAQLTANTATSPARMASIAALADGGFVVAWCTFEDRGTPPGANRPAPGYDIVVRRFDRSGAAAGAEVRANADSTYGCGQPSPSGLAGGGFALAWWSFTTPPGTPGFFPGACLVRVFPAGGAPGAETDAGPANTCASAAVPDGGFVVVSERPHFATARGIVLQRFDDSGAPAGAQAHIDGSEDGVSYPTAPPDATSPAVAGSPDGNVVLAWVSGNALVAQRFTPGGMPLTVRTARLATVPTFITPRVAAGTDGGFAVSWYVVPGAPSPTPRYELFAQRFDAAGTARDAAASLATFIGTGQVPQPVGHAVSASTAGRYVVGWQQPGTGDAWDLFLARR